MQRFSRHGNILAGCLIVLAVFIAAAIGVGIWVANSWKGWAAGAITTGVDNALTEAQIDPAEQQEIMVHVEDLMARFEQGDLSLEELGLVVESLMNSPLVPYAVVTVVDNTYISASDLSEEERADARVQLTRYAAAVGEGDLDRSTIDTVVAPLEDPTPDETSVRITVSVDTATGETEERVLKSPGEATGDDLRAVVAEARRLADEAGVTETPEPIDLSDEVEAAIAEALGGVASSPAGGEEDAAGDDGGP